MGHCNDETELVLHLFDQLSVGPLVLIVVSGDSWQLDPYFIGPVLDLGSEDVDQPPEGVVFDRWSRLLEVGRHVIVLESTQGPGQEGCGVVIPANCPTLPHR